jgi:hypothetical protein
MNAAATAFDWDPDEPYYFDTVQDGVPSNLVEPEQVKAAPPTEATDSGLFDSMKGVVTTMGMSAGFSKALDVYRKSNDDNVTEQVEESLDFDGIRQGRLLQHAMDKSQVAQQSSQNLLTGYVPASQTVG